MNMESWIAWAEENSQIKYLRKIIIIIRGQFQTNRILYCWTLGLEIVRFSIFKKKKKSYEINSTDLSKI